MRFQWLMIDDGVLEVVRKRWLACYFPPSMGFHLTQHMRAIISSV